LAVVDLYLCTQALYLPPIQAHTLLVCNYRMRV
jgi:hypothetical protein